MIYSFGGRNCWSFKEWVDIDFSLNKSVPVEYGFDDISVAPALCFEGANASGKSCALRVISFIANFCLNSFQDEKPNDRIFYDTFFSNKDKSEFYLVFSLLDNINERYKYQVVLDNNQVYSEKLYLKENGRAQLVFSRIVNTIKTNKFFKIPKDFPELRNNVSFFSTFFQYNISAAMPFWNFFSNIFSNVGYIGTNKYKESDLFAKYYYENPEKLQKVVKYLKIFDTGIDSIVIKKMPIIDEKESFVSFFMHQTENGLKPLTVFSQSMGTKVLYNKLLPLLFSVENGGFIIYDELDCHLHPAILPIILDNFLNPYKNEKHSQIVFTSHNTALLDEMKKYRTYLFNKEMGESFCYRIDELPENIKIRNDRSLEQTYKSGILGGVPNV